MRLAEQRSSFGPAPLHSPHPYYELLRPCAPRRYSGPCGVRHLDVSLSIGATGSHVPYKSLVELRAAYMPDGAWAVSGAPKADPGGRVTPRFCHRLISFRHFISGSLALASLDRACRNRVPAFPQRSPPRLLPAAACGGLRSAPDHRTRRALLHLSYSCAPLITHAALVTHDPLRTFTSLIATPSPVLTWNF